MAFVAIYMLCCWATGWKGIGKIIKWNDVFVMQSWNWCNIVKVIITMPDTELIGCYIVEHIINMLCAVVGRRSASTCTLCQFFK